jgi:hypothetical protein
MSLLPLMVFVQVASAASVEEEQAEMARILEDMKQFREKANWTAVEKRYQQLLNFSKAEPTLEMYLLGAEASRNLGDVTAMKTRLTKALAIEETDKIRQWHDSIAATYAPVTIKLSKKLETVPELTIAMMPFLPDQQLALVFAQQMIQDNRKFKGYLPFGDYTMGETSFSVSQGDTDVVVVVKPAGSIDAVAKAEEANPSKNATSMRFDLGFAASNAGTSDLVGQPVDFGGVGTRMGVGIGYGLTDTLALVAEVGYHGSFGAGEAATLSGIVGGYDATPTIYNGVFGWLAASMNFNDLEVLVGPITEFASVQTQGINVSVDQVEYIVGQADYIPVQGSLLATGLSGGVTYAGMDVGEGLLGGVSTYVGAQSDGTRWYTWGQVSLTVKGK